MPKDIIDYSNTIIYKIICNDHSVTDIYVGHTTNFVKRKYQHKTLCNNKSKLKIYDVIRQNGGWDNWSMVEIAKYCCQDVTEARIKEQEHYELLKQTLNTVNPISSNKYSVLSINDSISIQKTNHTSERKFSCLLCDFHTSKKGHYNDHLLTLKHKNQLVGNKTLIKSLVHKQHDKYLCDTCSKQYTSRNGLWKHQQKCATENGETIKESILSDKELIMMLVKQNSQLMDVIKNGTGNPVNNINNSNNNTNHSHNKTFNLQFFLNETCKDAMNIGEFVDSIKPQLADLEATGRLGYVEGISNIILNGLKTLNTQERPIHCSDQKREIIYIKDNNEWTKEEEDKPILTKAIKVIANENIKNISQWRKEHPDCVDAESKKNDLYLKIVSNSMSGGTKEESNKNINKIISNLAKQVTINKSNKMYIN